MIHVVSRCLIALALAHMISPVIAGEKKYGPGVSDTEIKIGQTIPYSGPASSFGTEGRVIAAYYWTMDTARPERLNWLADWLRRTKSWGYSAQWGRRKMRPFSAT
jgi:hypothetical protein